MDTATGYICHGVGVIAQVQRSVTFIFLVAEGSVGESVSFFCEIPGGHNRDETYL
jgi:hypothetical protein